MKSVGLDNIIKNLKYDQKRFENAANCNEFCDADKCKIVSDILADTIEFIEDRRD